MLNLILNSKEYQAISSFYRDQTAERSGVPLINHINEGLQILNERNASEATMKAFCLHPLLQGDKDLQQNYQSFKDFDPLPILLAMEYRRAANAYLCKPGTDSWTFVQIEEAIGLLLPEVRDMLIADKLQNQKDFLTYHYGTHPRSTQLDRYFKVWLAFLGV